MIILIIRVGLVFNVKFDISGVEKLCDKLKKDLQSVKGAKAGVLKNTSYPPKEDKNKDPNKQGKGSSRPPLKVWQNALIQEYGARIPVTKKMRGWFMAQGFPLKKSTTEIIIPPRPFLRKALKNQKAWAKYVNEMFDANQDGHMTLYRIAKEIAEMMQDDIQEAISSNIPPENAEITKKNKRGSSRTLMDTGTLRSSILGAVIKK